MGQAFLNIAYKLQILAQWIRAQRKNMSRYGGSTVKIGACVVQNDRKLFSFGLLSHTLLPIGNR